ncbi:TIGR00341 family protein [Pseudohalioglobus sediminis]|uniref:TIGR00341 family protein n=1 Tax=Pseudohalioglobus sediminis TaxID=2606449 RepID=A0A5B0X3T2_9GAMM|nr:TIGR00341 family protein [Pseudohalioglobus sediminis]KAA1193984.1 TIGR00341 family protein [Pseudohalioglobus sediminis]
MGRFNLQQLLAERGLTPEERREVLEDLFVFGKKNLAPYLVRMSILLVLSTIIATAGLISDSAAVVIGAMLVAPLMRPVMAAAGAVVMGWPGRFYSALWLVFIMGLGALFISSLLTLASPELIFLPEQVLARTRPTYYDLLIALAAGSAGAYTITRKETSAIPGVAVAVALLPPLASAGILVTSGEYELATRALVLFLTNLIAMVLAGALTFLAVGVSPATQRKKSADFAKSQISLFLVLTVAVCIPLWFYSDKVIFNAHYQAAKSEILQQWLRNNRLEMTDVDILRETHTIHLSLEGPSPPVNIGDLHEQFMEARNDDAAEPFKIRYTWTQKVSGVWPQEADSIGEVARKAQVGIKQLVANRWRWRATQYDAETATRPSRSDSYTLLFMDDGKFEVTASCGLWTGKFKFAGRALNIESGRNLLSACRKDEVLRIFLDDLERARVAFIENDRLQITLAGSEGIMYFEKYRLPINAE